MDENMKYSGGAAGAGMDASYLRRERERAQELQQTAAPSKITPHQLLRMRAHELRNEAAALDRLADALPGAMDYPAELALIRIIEKSLR